MKMIGENRLDYVLGSVNNLFAKMVSDEENKFDMITRKIEHYDRERMELRLDLGSLDQDIDDDEEANMSLVNVERKIKTEVKRLREKKAERMKAVSYTHLTLPTILLV